MTRQWVAKNLYVGSWLDQPVIESPKQGNIIFEIFEIFVETKKLS